MRGRRLHLRAKSEQEIRNLIHGVTPKDKESKKSLQHVIKLDTNANALKKYLLSKEAVRIFGSCRRLAGPALLSKNLQGSAHTLVVKTSGSFETEERNYNH